jgi:hypothetical protein
MSLAMRLPCAALLSASLFAQHGHRDPTPHDRDANSDRLVLIRKPDSAQALWDSQELPAHSQSVYTDAPSAASGAVLKDLRERLKKIEKLSITHSTGHSPEERCQVFWKPAAIGDSCTTTNLAELRSR